MHNLPPLVSVIMPVKDNEKYLSIAIESILTQTYQNIELIIIDDSKYDLCSDIIKSYTNNIIKYFKGPKINLATALNMGIDNSKGEYIARMDSDDIAHQDRILQQVNALKLNSWDICGTWIKQFGNDSRLNTYPSKPEDIKYWMMFTCAIAHPTVLAKSEIFRNTKMKEILIPAALDKIQWHKVQGHDIWLVSASYDFILEKWALDTNINLITNKTLYLNKKRMFCTNDINFEEKLIQIKKAINLNEYNEIYAYGDSDGDKKMLEIATKSFYKYFN